MASFFMVFLRELHPRVVHPENTHRGGLFPSAFQMRTKRKTPAPYTYHPATEL